MYNIIGYADFNAGVKEYVVDTVAELQELPGDMGSSAFCFEDKSFYIKNGNDTWEKV
jgi:hypothetical protein